MRFADVVIDGSGPHLDRLFTYRIPLSILAGVTVGSYVVAPWGKSTRGAVVRRLLNEIPDGVEEGQVRELLGLAEEAPVLSSEEWHLIDWMRDFYMASWSACLQTVLPGPVLKGARKVVKGGKRRAVSLKSLEQPGLLASKAPTLTVSQQQAWDSVKARLTGGSTVLLYGVTGSGKTELYMRACQQVLSQGLGAIVLVPEVSLTPQTRARFAGRFAGMVSILHSGLSDAERRAHWWQIRRGNTLLVVGTRSAVFAPLPSLGLIIIDEEHDSSYKQSADLRYHARQVAAWRVRQSQGCLLLGSATPCLESYYLALQGRYSLVALKERIGRQPMPTIQLVKGFGLPPQVIRALRDTKQAGAQSVILLNRRGFSRYLMCQDCGWVPQCRYCSISLSFHLSRRTLMCHYCGCSRPAPEICQECRSRRIDMPGQGTEKVEKDLSLLLPDLRLARLDRDTVGGGVSEFARIYDAFAKHELDAILGTQMVAKGLDFPLVCLVVVLDADVGLNFPDFRASERTYALLTQVAGRAGRGQSLGRVIIVCRDPEQQVFQDLLAGNHEEFMRQELVQRRELRYPPFCRMLRLLISDPSAEKVERVSCELGRLLLEAVAALQVAVEVLGPSPCPIEKIQNRYRWQILLKASKVQELHAITRKALSRSQPRGARIILDQDPMELM